MNPFTYFDNPVIRGFMGFITEHPSIWRTAAAGGCDVYPFAPICDPQTVLGSLMGHPSEANTRRSLKWTKSTISLASLGIIDFRYYSVICPFLFPPDYLDHHLLIAGEGRGVSLPSSMS